MTVNVADKVLCAIDRTDLWYAEAKYGGLSDIYFHEAIVGNAS